MNLSQAIGRYVAMKQLMGISFKRGRDVLEAFSGRLGELPLRSVTRWQVLEFLEQSVLSDVS